MLGFEGRSINMTIAARAWKGYERIGIVKDLEKMSVPLYGRSMWDVSGNETYMSYGREGDCLHSINRALLNKRIVEECAKYSNINMTFDSELESYDFDSNVMKLGMWDQPKHEHKPEFLFAADGAFSKIRKELVFQKLYLRKIEDYKISWNEL